MTADEQKIHYYAERLRALQREARKDGLAIGAEIGRGRRTPYRLTVAMLPKTPKPDRPPDKLDAPGARTSEKNLPMMTKKGKTEDGESERI